MATRLPAGRFVSTVLTETEWFPKGEEEAQQLFDEHIICLKFEEAFNTYPFLFPDKYL